jgi:hypothetical protein
MDGIERERGRVMTRRELLGLLGAWGAAWSAAARRRCISWFTSSPSTASRSYS